jgi:hypothetical protein
MILLPRGSGGWKEKLVLQKMVVKGKLALSNLVVSEFRINLYMAGRYVLTFDLLNFFICALTEIPLTIKGKLALSDLAVSEFMINLYMVGCSVLTF